MSESGESRDPQFPDIDSFLHDVLSDAQAEELRDRLEGVEEDQRLVQLAQLGEEFGIPVHPRFIDWFQDEERAAFSDDNTLNDYYLKLLAITDGQDMLELAVAGDDAELELQTVDELIVHVIDLDDPERDKWKRLAEHVIGRELLPGIEPQALPSVLDIVNSRVTQAQEIWEQKRPEISKTLNNAEAAIIERLGARDVMASVVYAITTLEIHSRDIDFAAVDLLEYDGEQGFVRHTKNQAIASIALLYDIDSSSAEEAVIDIIKSLRSSDQ